MAALAAPGHRQRRRRARRAEMPIMDGSAEPFVQLLDRAGRRPQAARRAASSRSSRPSRSSTATSARALMPADALRDGLRDRLRRPRRSAARPSTWPSTSAAFRRELADCRTFGFLHEVEALRAAGLARGGSLDNVRGDRRRPGAEPRRPAPARRVRAPQGAGRHRRPLCARRADPRPLRGPLRRPRPQQRAGPRPAGPAGRLALRDLRRRRSPLAV